MGDVRLGPWGTVPSRFRTRMPVMAVTRSTPDVIAQGALCLDACRIAALKILTAGLGSDRV
ncbi:hypothetical protein SCWH03_41620 [Streptomyces pacificus]|uniref:Uncharacterized protein n=1 Tax=Streptomyces pacificus TaxID=2705029 RepID=A0A6A0AYJ6_9ACTN|nr:hypothetical protein SCWH03_41620 [Streptomyces pacificus]